MNTETVPLETTITTFLEGLDEPLAAIHEVTSKTDADFINERQEFDPKLKRENYAAISSAITGFNKVIKDKRIKDAARADGQSTIDAIALDYASSRGVKIPDWRFDDSGERRSSPVPPIRGSAEELRPILSGMVTKVREIVEWWSDLSPYLVNYEDNRGNHQNDQILKQGVTIFPARGPANVCIEERVSTFDDSSAIYAELTEGQRVVVSHRKGNPVWVDVDHSSSKFTMPLVGYYKNSGNPSDFLGRMYEGFHFLSEEKKNIGYEEDGVKYAARIAMSLLVARKDAGLPEIDLVLPSEEYCNEVVSMLARRAIQAFLMPKLGSRVNEGGGPMTGYEVESVDVFPVQDLIKNSTERELQAFLKAAGATAFDLTGAVEKKLADMHSSEILGDRINAIRVQDNVNKFLYSLS